MASALNGDLQGHRAIESVYGYLVAGRDELAHGTQKPQTLRRHLIWLGKLPVMEGIVERLVPDELWELFQ
ncbi:hypothetical protein, partial [Streptomyces tendae]|uniref:hypothetical protein n=1 Tax=Streptomyces tendae TaxID=1932 RepID=UPI003687C5EE